LRLGFDRHKSLQQYEKKRTKARKIKGDGRNRPYGRKLRQSAKVFASGFRERGESLLKK
jgi:hypothetical protein